MRSFILFILVAGSALYFLSSLGRYLRGIKSESAKRAPRSPDERIRQAKQADVIEVKTVKVGQDEE